MVPQKDANPISFQISPTKSTLETYSNSQHNVLRTDPSSAPQKLINSRENGNSSGYCVGRHFSKKAISSSSSDNGR
uniref:Ovule protein n=1 Tax=Steinernema glaseri TaxID=37863 RepID=A0A1I7Z8U3_9BILA